MSEFRFRSISWEWRNGFSLNFAHALILTSNLGLLIVHFHPLLSYGPWMMSEISFCSISWEEIDFHQILQMHWYRQLGIVKRPFLSLHYRVMALEWRQNFVSVIFKNNVFMLKLRLFKVAGGHGNKKFPLEPRGRLPWNFVYSIGYKDLGPLTQGHLILSSFGFIS